jgi:tetratricopeptide (TPR) repeat protein
VIGETLSNRYKILRELGAGGMAWVYLAEDLLENNEVAVKVLYPQFNRDMSYVQRFVREAKLAIQVSSDHIVRILNYGADRDVHYLVMENIEGQDLAAVLRERGSLPWEEALQIAAQVAQALDAANTHGVVHRDIKPQNIMITPANMVKVLDFGIARARALPSLTRTGFVGSPYYISPEQATGKDVDIRSDIYSLGIVIYEMLSGQLPFASDTPWSIISRYVTETPPDLNIEELDLPAQVKDLVNKMLAQNPAERHQTPADVVGAIESILRERGIDLESSLPAVRPTAEAARLSKAHDLLLSSLYQRATEATQAAEWPQAVNLFAQLVRVDPGYRDAPQRLAYAESQARLVELYDAAQDALVGQRWLEAKDKLDEIGRADPAYRDTANLLSQAERALSEMRTSEDLARLYEEGLAQYRRRQWHEASVSMQQVLAVDPGYQDASQLYSDARRHVRWSDSLLGRVSLKLSGWATGNRKAPVASGQHVESSDGAAAQKKEE